MEANKYPFGKVVAGARSLHIRGLLHKESISYSEIEGVTVSKFFKRLRVESKRGTRTLQLWSLEEAELLAQLISENMQGQSRPEDKIEQPPLA